MAPKWCSGSKVVETQRMVQGNAADPHPHYMGNFTRTSKYSLITFFPKALFEQYRRIANVYFTIVAALSLTEFSPVRPWTTWLPLAFVLGVSMIKEAFEDYGRYKVDKEVNSRPVLVLDPSPSVRAFVTRAWHEVRVGDIIIVKRDEAFPADMLFLGSENVEGTCYVETMNLDGETNLKIKKALDETMVFTHDKLVEFKGCIECEPPNSRLYQFTGNLLLDPPVTSEAIKVSISPAALLLRGCHLRNTPRIFGLVIYAGHETKIFKNTTHAPSKRSVVERTIDKIILFMFCLLFSFCMTGCVYFAFWTSNRQSSAWYLLPSNVGIQYDSSSPGVVGVTNFITVFILYGYLIPISMYVTVEVVKVVQAMLFISQDREMYHAETDTPAKARTSNLNEELGMVNTVLSDKTGTLTRNVMEFFKCSIAGVAYGAGVTEVERSNSERKGIILSTKEDPASARYRESFFNFYDKRIMDGAWTSSQDVETVEMFFRLLAVCHTVIPDGPMVANEIKYEAESPDEAALVVAAKACGFFFCKRTNTTVTVRETTSRGTEDVDYELLNVLEFNSTRKRMSVVVRDSKGKLLLFCKGADTVIYERLEAGHPQNTRFKVPSSKHMEEFGNAGLRTLCLAYAEVHPTFYAGWQKKYVEAKQSLQDRDEKLDVVSELMERNLRLLGSTAIEDKLQEGVPQCIKQLAHAGIRLWVLTGDKMETAINIGFACSLINEEMSQFIVSASSPDIDALEEAGRHEEAAVLGHQRISESLTEVESQMSAAGHDTQFALIIDGKALGFALHASLAPLFLKVGLQCTSVICCRVSPLQKAQVTGLVRDHGDVTLAIGDGANDVGMIQKAHIGVGISGQEGMQAVMSADFAIAQFRYLTPLLLVHGRWSYKRITRMICFFFYKNLLFGITIFTFNAFAAFSGQFMYNDFYMTLFNVIFTVLTPFVIGAFDRDVDREMAYRYPIIYRQGQRNDYFSLFAISGWIFTAAYQAAVIMVFILVGCGSTVVNRRAGQPFTMWETGVLMFSCVVVTVHLEVVQIQEQWTWLHHVSIWVSQLVWWLFLLAFGAFPLSFSTSLYDLFLGIVAASPQYWLYLVVVPLACQLPDFFVRAVRRHVWPDDHHILMELQLKERREKRDRVLAAGKGVGPPSQAEDEQDPQAVVLRVFNGEHHSGFVAPYTADSRFYKLPPGAVNSGPSATTMPTDPTSLGSQPGAVRNPVLHQLDIQLAASQANPIRKRPLRLAMAPAAFVGTNQAGDSDVVTTPIGNLHPVMQDNHMNPDDSEMMEAYTSAVR